MESILEGIQQQYKQMTKKDVTLKVDHENFLPSESCGGVELLASKGNYVKEKSSIRLWRYYFLQVQIDRKKCL